MDNTEEQKQLGDFSWDQEEIEFFGQAQMIEKLKEPEKKEGAEEELEEKEEVTDFFNMNEEKEEPEEKKKEDTKEEKINPIKEVPTKEESEKKETSEEENAFIILSSEMKEKGLLSLDFDPNEIDDEEKFFELQDQEVESRAEEKLKSLFGDMDDDAKLFIRFKEAGGDTSDFFKIMQSSMDVNKFKNIEDEKTQENIIKYQLGKEKFSDDEIEDRIQWLKDGNKLKKTAEGYYTKIKEEEDQKKIRVIESQKQTVEVQKQNIEKFNQAIKSSLDKSDKLDVFGLNKKDKDELYAYISRPAVKVGEGRYYTQLQDDMRKLYSDPEQLLLLSQVIKSGFNFTNLKTNLKNETIKKTQSKLNEASFIKKNLKNTTLKGDGKLTDYFDK